MAKSTRQRRRHRQIGGGQLVRAGHGGLWRLAARPPADLSHDARRRLAMLDWHAAHGANVSLTARHFGLSRPTVYRWLGRFERLRLETLEDHSSAPHSRRRPTWTVAQVEAVQALRERYPRWGKAKLRVLLRRDGVRLSVSMVGRILAYLARRGLLREPVSRRVGVRQRHWPRPHAVRLPKGLAIERPGDLVELDTLDIRPSGVDHPFKQFTARDRVSRWDTLVLGRRATARAAADVLDALAARMPFAVRAISVDNGSEFMAEFELACQARGIALFHLPPRSPKLHGSVECANRTHTEEFYEVTDAGPELESLQAGLADWEVCYNTVRPHEALGHLTPAEYLASIGVMV
ncbi:MAG: helix-turn-helix domain-containing protein [Candidatus Limnocylindrales bacterium]